MISLGIHVNVWCVCGVCVHACGMVCVCHLTKQLIYFKIVVMNYMNYFAKWLVPLLVKHEIYALELIRECWELSLQERS